MDAALTAGARVTATAVPGIGGRPASPIHRLDPRAKTLGLVGVTLVAVSAPPRHWPVYAGAAAALAAVAAIARVTPRDLWRRVRVVLPLVLAVGALVPFSRSGGETWALGPLTASEAGLVVFAGVAAKAAIGTTSAALLAATTPFPSLLRGLEALRVPRLLTLVAAFMYRYLFVIGDEVARMRLALAARGHRPRHLLHGAAVGRVATALFLRSHARGERVYLAMAARGYRGAMPQLERLRFGAADAAFVAALAATLLVLRMLVEVGP
jgi:cobalt/nickel transport system permease protein